MSSPTSVDFLPRRLESIAVSPVRKKKRIKTMPPPVPETPPVDANLQNMPSELIAKVLVFLVPNISHPVYSECGLVNLAQVSKRYRALALDDVAWKRMCMARWRSKVDYASRLAKAEAEAEAEGEKDTINTLVKGSYWHRKFFAEERSAAKTTITLEELCNIEQLSLRLWFRARSYPSTVTKPKGVFPSGLDGNSVSDAVRFLPSGKVEGLPKELNSMSFFEMNDVGSIISLGRKLKLGNHPVHTMCVRRRPDWGWQFLSNQFIMRPVYADAGGSDNMDKLWSDFVSKLVVEVREEGVACTRSNVQSVQEEASTRHSRD